MVRLADRRRHGARPSTLAGSEAGTTLIEMLVALGITAGVLGASGALAGQMQGSYRLQVETAEAQQEARYAIEWITRHLRSAGNNPYALTVTPCPVAGTPVMGIRLDPDGDGVDDDIRIQSDRFPANGLIGGGASNCTEAGEDVTISHDPAALTLRLQDNNLGDAPEAMTDALVGALHFVYRDADGNVTRLESAVAFVETSVTVQSRVNDPATNAPRTSTLRADVRVRNR